MTHRVECKPRRLPADSGSMSDGVTPHPDPQKQATLAAGCKKELACGSCETWGRKNGSQNVISYLIGHCLRDLLVANACEP